MTETTSSLGRSARGLDVWNRSLWDIDILVTNHRSSDSGQSWQPGRSTHHRPVTWRSDRLPELVRAMAGRPRHEALRGHVIELLRSGFGAAYQDIEHEVYLLDNSGRMDALWGATVIELKSDLRREIGDVVRKMPDYLRDAAARAGSARPVTGLATDGATFIAYTMQNGGLAELARHETNGTALKT